MEASEPFRKLIPEIIEPFRLVREIGSGGNGVVFLAERREQFAQRVAIKIFFPELFPASGLSLDIAGAAPFSELKHPGIVGLLDSGITGGGLRYLVMEYVEGDPLDVHCDKNRLSISQRIEVLCSVLEALEYAHQRLVIHADLKPDNIRVTPDGRPRLLDFGTSKPVTGIVSNRLGAPDAEAPSEISEHTPLYASPEQRRGERLTIASDLYSMGLILGRLLTGAEPVPAAIFPEEGTRTAESFVSASRMLAGLDREIVGQIARNRSTTPEALRRSLGPDVDAIMERALQTDPAGRYESAQEMRNELERFRLGYPLRTRPIGRLSRVYKWALRNRLAAGFACIFLLAVCLSVTGVAWRTVEAKRQRAIAQDRLHELVRLTDALAGELIGPLQGLQGAEAAQDALLKSAHETIRTLAAEKGDPQLQLELARQFQQLARLELSRTPGNAAAGQIAQDDIRQAGKLLDQLDQNDAEIDRLQRDNEALVKLEDGPAKDKEIH